MKKFSKILIAAVLAVFLVAGSSWATAMLEISGTGFSTLQLSDSDGDGIIYWGSGPIGAFQGASAFAVTKPQIGGNSFPSMHLNGAATTGNGGTFTVKFTDTDFGPLMSGINGFISSMNGANGTQSLEVYYDTTNTPFGQEIRIADIDLLNTDEIFNGIPDGDQFSLTMISTMSLGAGSAGSFDNTVDPVPEPASILLLGGGLLAMAGVIRKKMLKS